MTEEEKIKMVTDAMSELFLMSIYDEKDKSFWPFDDGLEYDDSLASVVSCVAQEIL